MFVLLPVYRYLHRRQSFVICQRDLIFFQCDFLSSDSKDRSARAEDRSMHTYTHCYLRWWSTFLFFFYQSHFTALTGFCTIYGKKRKVAISGSTSRTTSLFQSDSFGHCHTGVCRCVHCAGARQVFTQMYFSCVPLTLSWKLFFMSMSITSCCMHVNVGHACNKPAIQQRDHRSDCSH